MMRVITLASAACLDVLQSFNGSETEPLCDTLWQLVPRSINLLVSKVDEQRMIISTVSAMRGCILHCSCLNRCIETGCDCRVLAAPMHCYTYRQRSVFAADQHGVHHPQVHHVS